MMKKPKEFISSHAAGCLLAVSIFICLVGMGFETKNRFTNPVGLVRGSAAAIQYLFASVGNFFSGTVNSIGELRDLRKDYRALQNQVEHYQIIQRDLDSLRAENDRLRDQLSFSGELSYRHVPARVIAMDPGTLFHGMTVDKGMSSGVAVDMPVIAYQDGRQGLVGKVISATSRTAMILPVFDHECFVAARFSAGRYEGLVGGDGKKGGALFMRYVKKRAKEEIRYGDLVVTSGLRSIYPASIPIGRVVGIEAPEWQPSLIIEIEPAIDFSRLEYVFILKQEPNQ